ncbi:carbohydrate ABC transporter permease [Paenibacillus flagellatus]|uniref:Sugar ABC transporter permease n=1 Tax=Paenibacillus flagellatus TaxID=2211139 RepID=A0A2V5K949_9BACL|nr:sugar ABC transporter permease [Paenibacillus flagellatus]PYI55958.1 sugar ABC transporter permease [Paenibacillus flagellatus]
MSTSATKVSGAGTGTTAVASRKRRLLQDVPSWLLIVPSLLFFIVFHWQPLVTGFLLSFFETKGYNAVRFNGLQNYIDVMSNSVFQQTLVNTFLYVIWSLAIGFLVPIVVAVMINEMMHGQSFFKFAVYFPGMVPGVAGALLWMFMFDPGPGGLLNMMLGKLGLPMSQWLQNSDLTIPLIILTMTWRSFGGTVILYLASLQGVNNELYEAAALDGAGIWKRIRHITIPQISHIIGILLILQMIGVFQVLYEPLTMTEGGPNNASMSLMLTSYHYAFRYFEAGRSLAVGVITFIILAVMTAIYFRINKKSNTD